MKTQIEKMYNFGKKYAQTYHKKCRCGKTIEISTQRDENPEYYTEVFIRCECGKSVGFELPVN